MALITFASNNGDIGGGEEMLLALALAARELGHDVTVVAPATPDGVVRRARSSGFRTIAIKGQGRRAYLANLRAWDAAERQGLLWCNGLVPGVATAGRRNRVLHLHQPPQSRAQWAASFAARAGCLAVLCPSHDMATRLKNSWAFSQMEPTVLWNWVHDFPLPVIDPAPGLPHRIGFLGRTTEAKGIVVLAEALEILNSRDLGGVRLVIGGDTRFADSDEQIRVDRALAKVEPLVERLGWVTRGEFFAQVELSVFPSVWAEPFGLVVAEAQYAGAPFVISDAGALPEVAGFNHPWVSPAGDAEALASVVEQALIGTQDAVIAAAQLRWKTHFSPTAGRTRLASFLKTIDIDRITRRT